MGCHCFDAGVGGYDNRHFADRGHPFGLVVVTDAVPLESADQCPGDAATGAAAIGAGLLSAGGDGAAGPLRPTDAGFGLGGFVLYLYRLADRLGDFFAALRGATGTTCF